MLPVDNRAHKPFCREKEKNQTLPVKMLTIDEKFDEKMERLGCA